MEVESRPAGRPRDDAAGPALLAAARRLVIEHGYEGVSIQMIAAEAGVGRQTLYRRWTGKADLVLEAFLESAQNAERPRSDEVTTAALERFLEQVFAHLLSDGPAIRSLIASAQTDPEFLAVFKKRFVEPRARIVADILRTGIERGDIDTHTDVEMAVTMLHGAFWYPLLLGELPDQRLAERIVRTLYLGIATG